MATPTKKARDTIFSWRFVNQVNDFSNSLYCKQLLQWLVEGVTYVANECRGEFVPRNATKSDFPITVSTRHPLSFTAYHDYVILQSAIFQYVKHTIHFLLIFDRASFASER